MGQQVAHEIQSYKVCCTNKTHPIYSQYSLYSQKLKHVSETKYLGLTLDTNLNFNKHTDIICK